MKNNTAISLSLAGLAAVLAPPVLAGDAQAKPGPSGELAMEFEVVSVLDSDDPDAELSDAGFTLEPALSYAFTPHWSVQAALVLESVLETEPGEDRFVEDTGLYVEQLFIQYRDTWGHVYAGKFNPPFGQAWDAAPGLYGADFAEDYELTERVGLGAALTLGKAAVSVNVFTTDRSVLSASLFTERDRVRLADGGAGNTESLKSFSLTLDGELGDNLGYHAAVLSQGAGAGGAGDETGLALGVVHTWKPDTATTLSLLLEGAGFRHIAGSEADARYLTTGLALRRGAWNLGLAGALRRLDGGGEDSRDWLWQLSGGYSFASGLSVELGYRQTQESGIRSQAVGLLAAYTLAF